MAFVFITKIREGLLRVHTSEYRTRFPVRNGTIIGKNDVMIGDPGRGRDPRLQDFW
jgi:hypothetical protein